MNDFQRAEFIKQDKLFDKFIFAAQDRQLTSLSESEEEFRSAGKYQGAHHEKETTLTWMMMSRQMPAPISDGSPYMPVITYTMAWPMVMIIPNTGRKCAQV